MRSNSGKSRHRIVNLIVCAVACVAAGTTAACARARAQNNISAQRPAAAAHVLMAGGADTGRDNRVEMAGRRDTTEHVHTVMHHRFKSRTDSLAWARNRTLAARSTGFRLVVSLQDFRVWAIVGSDTVLDAPAAVAKGTTLDYEGHEYTFATPRGVRHVIRKESDPVWIPPDWLYVETAAELIAKRLLPRDIKEHIVHRRRKR